MKRQNGKVNIYYLMRVLHRDIGFLTIGLTLVYALSGMLLIYRNTDFMKVNRTEEIQLETGLKDRSLGLQLRIRAFDVTREEGSKIFFKEGVYDTETGIAVVTRKVYLFPLDKLVNLHKVTGTSKMSIIALAYGFMLTFLAVSSLFMFKLGSRKSRRGMVMIAISAVLTVVIVMLV
ncbi:MAG: hypothetical protein Q4G63_05435 [Bacteroidia bacterium]|nr:hypothetical protein [Bacteroidia bacterium]